MTAFTINGESVLTSFAPMTWILGRHLVEQHQSHVAYSGTSTFAGRQWHGFAVTSSRSATAPAGVTAAAANAIEERRVKAMMNFMAGGLKLGWWVRMMAFWPYPSSFYTDD